MGRTSATTLLLLSLAACGDNLDDGSLGAGPADDIHPAGNGDVIPRYVPHVCGVNSWSPTVSNPEMALSVVQRPTGGATLVSAPRAGGSIYGFNLDPRMDMVGVGQKVLDGTFDNVSISYVGGRPVTTSVAGGAVYVNVLDDNLAYPQFITKVPGSFVGEPAFYKAQTNILMPVVDDTGLSMYRFDDSLEPIDSKHFVTTAPARSIAVSQLGTAMMTSWSTDTSCYLHVNTTYEAGVTATVDAPCTDPKIAINQTSGDGVMLFDSPQGIRLMGLHTTMMGGDARLIRSDATSPRALFDGTNFWVSYLDARGDIVVGFLDENHNPVTMSLGAAKPDRLGYELVEVEGSPWVFSLDADGYSAYRMCVEAVW
jgi:hypothetical protein